jgi:tetratricopeptide (TPR) repeat protein
MTELTRCPAYEDLLVFADNGETAPLAGHAPDRCPRCSERLAEYATVREALQGLAGIELFSPAALNAAWDETAPDAGDIAPVRELLAFARDPGCGAPALADARKLLAQARENFFRDWPRAAQLAAAARQAAFSAPAGETTRLARALGRSLQAETTGALGHCLVSSGKFEEGLALLLDAHHRWTGLGDPLGLGGNLINLAVAYMYKKRLKTAEGCARQAIAVLGAIGQEAEVAAARQALAIILGDLGERDEALREAQHAAGAFRKLGRPLPLGQTLHTVAGHLFALHRNDEALATVIEARRLIDAQGDRLSAARCDWLQGQIECDRPESFAAGIARLERAASALMALDQWLETVCLLCDKAALELGAGRLEEARRDFALLLSRLPADRVNSWVSEALLGLHRLFERAETDALIRALGEFNRRLQSGEAPVQTDGSETRH